MLALIMMRPIIRKKPSVPFYPHLFRPLQTGPVTLKNRIVMGSMHTYLESMPDGSARAAAFYAERARGGVALIITGGYSPDAAGLDRKSTRLNSSHLGISYAVFCLKKN